MAEQGDSRVTQLLAAIGEGDPAATDELLPLVYTELRALAHKRMAAEPPGHTLEATALVHEAYLRLLGEGGTSWNSRGHFYGAAAEAMRRILVERARKRGRIKHGGGRRRVPLTRVDVPIDEESVDLLGLDEALEELKDRDRRMYDVAMLRQFCGLTSEQTAKALGVSVRTVKREWSYAQVWLYERISRGQATDAQGGAGDG
ncbi:MAG: ECF-type sigma factor [Planctomycetota bacterium]